MSEKRILIASLLKPINDTRMYEKLGLSLCKLPQAQVHIVGFQAPTPLGTPLNIKFHPLFNFRRLSLGRVTAQLAYFKLLQQLKPDLVIVCTHELLLASYLYCRQQQRPLVYDVQENYRLNLTSQDNYNALLKKLLGWSVGTMENLLARHVSHFLVAEQSYLQELSFLGHRYTLLENKYKKAASYTAPSTPVIISQEPLRLLYTGTIARLYGVFEAIELAEKLHQLTPGTTLTIMGYCADSATYQQLQQAMHGKPYITLVGGKVLVPHQQLLKAIVESNVALLPYQPHVSTFSCFPTKLYEYAAYALPMIVQYNPLWDDFLQASQAGFSVDFASIDAFEVLNHIRKMRFYEPGVPSGVFWVSEEKKLLKTIQKHLKQKTSI